MLDDYRAEWLRSSEALQGIEGSCHLLAFHAIAADEQDRSQVENSAEAVQHITGQSIELTCVDQGFTGETRPAGESGQGIRKSAVDSYPCCPDRTVTRRLARTARFRRLVKDDERLVKNLTALHFVAFAILMLANLARQLTQS